MNRKKFAPAAKSLLIETLESRQMLSATSSEIVSPSLVITPAVTSSGTIEGYTPAQIKAAYGISSISFDGVSGTGAGETISIVDAYSDPNIASDLAVFDKEFDLAAPPSLKQESATGSTTKLPAEDAGWDGEISLDVEWAHAIAPKANIILVDAASDSMSGLMSAVEFARTIPTVSVISMSWGGSEFAGETSYDKYFTTPSGHIGITFVAASGDEGAAGGAEYPAASPNVLSVGGTTLDLSSSGKVESESAWSDSSGGVSAYESTPTYQSAVSSTGRSTPDVSYDADPDTGFAVYDSVSDDGTVGWQEVGGTSAGTPQWSALIAIADQGRATNHLATLDGATGTLPTLYSIYSNSTNYAADFTDITSGSSVVSEGGGFGGPFGGGFGGGFRGGRGRGGAVQEVSATTGYDTLTGLGTPKAAALVETLAAVTVSKSSVVKTTAVTAAKTVKTKAAAAIDINRAASVFGAGILPSAERSSAVASQTVLEVETAAATTVAAAIDKPESSAAGALGFRPEVLPLETPTRSALDEPENLPRASEIASVGAEPLLAEPEAQASHDSPAASLPSLFSDTFIGREIEELSQSAAALLNSKKEPESSLSAVVLAAAVTADAALIGFFYAKRKNDLVINDIFNDGSAI